MNMTTMTMVGEGKLTIGKAVDKDSVWIEFGDVKHLVDREYFEKNISAFSVLCGWIMASRQDMEMTSREG